MDMDLVHKIARDNLQDRMGHPDREIGYVYHHGLRVGQIAVRLAGEVDEDPGVPDEILLTAGMFHDVAKGIEPHNEVGADVARRLLANAGPAGEVDRIARLVREHNQRRQASECLPASRILQDADILDHYGAQNVWLGVFWAAFHRRTAEQTIHYHLEDEGPAYHARIRKLLNYAKSRKAFDARVAVSDAFFRRLRAECEGQL